MRNNHKDTSHFVEENIFPIFYSCDWIRHHSYGTGFRRFTILFLLKFNISLIYDCTEI